MGIQTLSQPSVLEFELFISCEMKPISPIGGMVSHYIVSKDHSANTWEVYSIHPIDARAYIGLYRDIEDPRFQLALGS